MNLLKEGRQKLGWTMKQVAEQLDISESYYCLLEQGRRSPSARLAKKLGDLMGFDWTVLVLGEDF